MVSVDKIEKGVAKYLDAELIPKLPENSWKQFGAGVVSALVAKRGGSVIEAYKHHPVLKAFGVVDEAGMLDAELLRDIAKERIPETGLSVDVPLLGTLKLYRADVDKLYGHIVGQGVRFFENH